MPPRPLWSEMVPVRRRARALTRQLTMPEPWSIAAVCEQVGELRGREIVLEQSTTIASTALVRREPARDVITYRADHHNTDHLIAHELGHLLAGHLDGPTDLSGGFAYDLRGAVTTMQRSCSYTDPEERLAEAVADLLMAAARSHTKRGPIATGAATTLRGFGEAMR